MRRIVIASSIAVIARLRHRRSRPWPRRRGHTQRLLHAERPLIEVKPDPKTGKIIGDLGKAGADGVSARFIYLTQLETVLGSAPITLLDKATPGRSPDHRLPLHRQESRRRRSRIGSSSPEAETGDERQGVRAGLSNFDDLDGRRHRQTSRTALSRSTLQASLRAMISTRRRSSKRVEAATSSSCPNSARPIRLSSKSSRTMPTRGYADLSRLLSRPPNSAQHHPRQPDADA